MATSPVSSNSSSALDVASIVSQLMQVESRPMQLLQVKEANFQGELSAFGRLQGAVSSLQTAAQALNSASDFAGRTATVSGTGASASATSSAAVGRYDIAVTALAQSQALVSGPLATSATVVGTGTLTIDLGTYDSGGNTFTAKSGSVPLTLTIDSTNNTLAGIRDAINNANAGVGATIVNDGTGYRLTLTSNDTGAVNSIRVTATDSDGNSTDATGLSQLAFDPTVALVAPATTAAGRNLVQTRAAQDASFNVNGLAMTSPSNTITEGVQGVTLNLLQSGTGAASTIVVGRDTGTIKSAITTFARAYSDLQKTIADLTKYDPTTKSAGALNGDSTARQIQGVLRGIIGRTVNTSPSDLSRLSDIGLEFAKDGSLTVNSAHLDQALQNPDKVARLLSTDASGVQGFAVQIANLTTSMIGSDGLLSARTQGIQSSITSLTKQQDNLQTRLNATQQRLTQQYTALDAQLSSMQAQSNALTQALIGLAANTGYGTTK